VPWESSSLVGEFSFARSVQEPDGSTMVLVPAGQFLMGTPEEEVTRLIAACVSLGDQEPQCRRWIAAEAGRRLVEQDSFWIDRYEVSNAQFGEFVRATAFVTTAERRGYGFVRGQGSKPGSVKVPGARWNLPKGPDRAAEAPYGVHDLAGNVWEWVDDWFSASDDRSGTPTRNPKGPHSGTRKIIRGGAWYNNWTAVRSARREPTKPDATSDVIGFRCARDLPGTANR
jgi:formylglycine-generating enzyme required for sulfatase activity